MWPVSAFQSPPKYKEVANSDVDYKSDSEAGEGRIQRKEFKASKWLKILLAITPWAIIVILLIFIFRQTLFRFQTFQASHCKEIPRRQEWRELTPAQQNSYIRSVQCLYSKPSLINPGDSLKDDFSWVHVHTGHNAHMDSYFLSWHRYFLHIYENKLRECGYTSPLPYWDWTIDRANISRSPIWDSFGGDGNSNSEQMKTLGYCVEDGPFAFYESKYWLKHLYPHCLTRRFDKNGPNPESYSEHLGPEAMQNLFSQTTYEDFCTTLETQVHDAIPTYIGGEFYWFTAPNDPVFFLHHAQIDRLWWLWQQDNPRRLVEYNGYADRNSSKKASINDLLPMLGLAPDLPVSTIISTTLGLLCYRY